jgi:hypothetical protein
LPLVKKFAKPRGVAAPVAVAVMCDGGRIQILDRQVGESPAAPEATSRATAGEDDFDDEPPQVKGRSKHWREDKIAILLELKSEVSAEDPCPELPEAFADPLRIIKLVKELGKGVEEGQEAAEEPAGGQEPADPLGPDAKYEPPEVLSRKVLATRAAWPDFAPMVASAARKEGFQGRAARRSWPTARRTTGRSRDASSGATNRCWTSFTPWPMCMRRH